jgi:peptidoglycan/LPS O-acetylase OafA/YrhL
MPTILTFDDFKSKRHFPGLDGIRCLSIVAVMYFHYSYADPRLGRLGVDLFFILSGFLITTLLLREREAFGSISLRDFWMRRILRIFPVYYGFILVQFLITKFFEFDSAIVSDFYSNLPAFLTFTNNWFVHLSKENPTIFYHAWSLAAEEQFYLFWPPLLLVLISIRSLLLMPLLLILIDLMTTQLVSRGVINLGIDGNSFITSLQPAICLGLVAAVILHHRRTFDLVTSFLSNSWLPSAALVFAIALIAAGTVSIFVHILLTIFLASMITGRDRFLSSVLGSPIAEFLGRISYGMYIFHMAAVNVIKTIVFPNEMPDEPVVIISAFALTIIAATASFYLYERPILALRSQFRPKATTVCA